MNTRFMHFTLCTLLFACSFHADAQQPKKVSRIGFLMPDSRATYAVRIEAFQNGLRELGYVEGQNIAGEWRFAGSSTIRSFAITRQ
jgi:putative ABC transport system substrate-binding protein